MARHVPDLRSKLEFLLSAGAYGSKSDLAAALGVAASTMRGWSTDGDGRNLDEIPEARFVALVDAVERALPRARQRQEVEALVLGRYSGFVAAFEAGAEVLLEDLLAAEARRDGASLYRASDVGLVELDGNAGDGMVSVEIGERFAIEFTTRRGGYLLALQNAEQAWGIVPFASGPISPRTQAGPVLLPGFGKSGPVYMREETSTGRHRFILFISPTPYPAVLSQAAAARKSLDWPMLGALARHYDTAPKHLREICLIEIRVTPRSG